MRVIHLYEANYNLLLGANGDNYYTRLTKRPL